MISQKEQIKLFQKAMNKQGEKLAVDGIAGPLTKAAAKKYTFEVVATKAKATVVASKPVATSKGAYPWMTVALSHLGKKETDPAFGKYMASHWYLVGLQLQGITKNYEAWCGLYVAYCYETAGLPYQKTGALARNWAKYGLKIDFKKNGIPMGAVVHINHKADPKSTSGNHVAYAMYDYAPEYLSNPNALVGLLGGNQGNMVKVSFYKVKTIMNVRWVDHKNFPLPGKVTKTTHSASGKVSVGDSTV